MENPYKSDRRYRVQSELFDAGFPDSDELYKTLYLTGLPACNHPMSSPEISEWLYSKHNILVAPKTIEYSINKMGIKRTKSEAKLLAIKTGRMVYRKKSKEEKYSAKNISAGTRLSVLTRDNFTCQYCGNGRKTGHSLEIHNLKGDESTEDNLLTLCSLCSHGLHENKRNKTIICHQKK